MAKAFTFSIGVSSYKAEPLKVELWKIYGFTEIRHRPGMRNTLPSRKPLLPITSIDLNLIKMVTKEELFDNIVETEYASRSGC